MIRKIALTAAFAAVSSVSIAADLPGRAPAPAPFTPVSAFSWTGLYAGANLGASFGNGNTPVFVAGGLFPTPASNLVPGSDLSGTAFTGGLQAGYNWQINSFVVGLETDINLRSRAGGLNGTYATNPAGYGAAFPTYTLNGFGQGNWFGTLRARAGFAADRALFFVTGGLAYGNTRTGGIVVNNIAPAASVPFTAGGNSTRAGWTLGAGIEYAVTNNWTVKGEYLHVDLGSKNVVYTGGGGGALRYTANLANRSEIVRLGVNYKF